MHRLRLTYANVAATLALGLALSGSAVAAARTTAPAASTGPVVSHVAKRYPMEPDATATRVTVLTLAGLGNLTDRCVEYAPSSYGQELRFNNTTTHRLWVDTTTNLSTGSSFRGGGTPTGGHGVNLSMSSTTSDARGNFSLHITDGSATHSADITGMTLDRPNDDAACVIELTAVSK